MFKTFLKIAARQLWQGRLYAVINVIERETTGDYTIPPADILPA